MNKIILSFKIEGEDTAIIERVDVRFPEDAKSALNRNCSASISVFVDANGEITPSTYEDGVAISQIKNTMLPFMKKPNLVTSLLSDINSLETRQPYRKLQGRTVTLEAPTISW